MTSADEYPKELLNSLGLLKYYESPKNGDKIFGTTSKTAIDLIWCD